MSTPPPSMTVYNIGPLVAAIRPCDSDPPSTSRLAVAWFALTKAIVNMNQSQLALPIWTQAKKHDLIPLGLESFDRLLEAPDAVSTRILEQRNS